MVVQGVKRVALLIRSLSILFAMTLTAGYLFSLYILTYAACFMHDATCSQGWIARTIGTLAYLAGIALTILLTRWSLRVLQRIRDRAATG